MQLVRDLPEGLTQPVRVVNRAGLSSSESSALSEIFYLACHYDAASEKTIILWDDVLDAFKTVVHVRDGARVLSFLKGSDLKNLDPLRIAAAPDATLDVVVEGHLTRLTAPSMSTIVAETAIQHPPCNWNNALVNTPLLQSATPAILPKSPSQPSMREAHSGTAGDDETTTKPTPESNSTIDLNPSFVQTASAASDTTTSNVEETPSESTSIAETPAQRPLAKSASTLATGAPLSGNSAVASDAASVPENEQPASGQPFSPSTTTAIANTSQEYAEIMSALGDIYEKGVGQDYQQAMKWSLRAANLGHPSAQCRVGLLYKKGNGVPQDYDKAKEWFLKAADQGFSSAQNNLGELYYFGHGVSEDHTKAIAWYLKAAEQGQLSAQYSLGYLYKRGHGVLQDYSKAMEWFLKAARHNHASAQYEMGQLYCHGYGVSKDYIRGKKWYLKAADQNFASAQYELGELYFFGRGVSKDRTEAMEWYKKAGRQGHAWGQWSVGFLFSHTCDIPQDRQKAIKWYRKAALQGLEQAKRDLVSLEGAV
ncbi:hypothetical protein BGW39_011257 [Mortierella sp. 14UC]|nr:hypothetical protein BGW39_011257 [Mortierella sp. 14UC]